MGTIYISISIINMSCRSNSLVTILATFTTTVQGLHLAERGAGANDEKDVKWIPSAVPGAGGTSVCSVIVTVENNGDNNEDNSRKCSEYFSLADGAWFKSPFSKVILHSKDAYVATDTFSSWIDSTKESTTVTPIGSNKIQIAGDKKNVGVHFCMADSTVVHYTTAQFGPQHYAYETDYNSKEWREVKNLGSDSEDKASSGSFLGSSGLFMSGLAKLMGAFTGMKNLAGNVFSGFKNLVSGEKGISTAGGKKKDQEKDLSSWLTKFMPGWEKPAAPVVADSELEKARAWWTRARVDLNCAPTQKYIPAKEDDDGAWNRLSQ